MEERALQAVHSPDASHTDSESDSDFGSTTPLTASQTPRTPRPSELKVHHCQYEGCTKSFNRLSRLAEHERSHTGERKFKCQEDGCDKDFLRESHLKHHVKSAHTNIRDYVCNWDGCDKKFATGTRLRRHLAAHEGREKYRCRGYEGCNETFRKHVTLTRHILSVHEGRKAFPCPENDTKTGENCQMAFDTAEKLRAHQRAQHDPTRFSCSLCIELIMEKNLQDGNKNFEDGMDQACHPTYALLQAHIAEFHPPTCPQCSKVCSTQRELRRHIEGVHGTLPNEEGSIMVGSHPCTYPGCAKSFSKRSNLNTHVNTVHKGRRAFICGETDLSASKNLPQELPGHILESCGRSFTSKSSLEEHVRTAHMGLQSRQVERKQRKRAAETASVASTDPSIDVKPKTKRRKPTKTPLSNLTGVRPDVISAMQTDTDPLNILHIDSDSFTAGSLPFSMCDLSQPYPGYIPYDSEDLTTPLPPTSTEDDSHDTFHDRKFSDLPSGPVIDPLLLLS